MTQEQEIKGILVHFFREGINGDYLDALNSAIKDIQQVKNCSIPDVVGRSEQLKMQPLEKPPYICPSSGGCIFPKCKCEWNL